MKKIVHFTKVDIYTYPASNKKYAVVWPVDHPDRLRVSNTEAAETSEVVDVIKDANGNVVEFETLNTIYRLKVEQCVSTEVIECNYQN